MPARRVIVRLGQMFRQRRPAPYLYDKLVRRELERASDAVVAGVADAVSDRVDAGTVVGRDADAGFAILSAVYEALGGTGHP